MHLQFDEKKLINDIIKNLNHELDIVAKVLIEFMIGELSQTHINPNNPEMNEWRLNIIEALKFRAVAVSGQLVREIGILEQGNEGLMAQALSLEFGTGSKINSTANPWYGEFISSEYYHDSREGTKMWTLPGEDVFDPLSGTWAESKATNRTSMDFMAQDPSLYWTNVFGNSAIMAQTYFDKGIDNAINRIDFSNYLIVK
ncbi:hypothetical protein [Clostridium sp.]|uniref:hypothetical protein n=1 Tax=Clostridium sp. TaxID=1506 RepID=UPI001A44BC06|nr:hypothetical protein [Clostridium sp.]MBK5239817.1 hypothetical protein [Clostridium sp.]